MCVDDVCMQVSKAEVKIANDLVQHILPNHMRMPVQRLLVLLMEHWHLILSLF